MATKADPAVRLVDEIEKRIEVEVERRFERGLEPLMKRLADEVRTFVEERIASLPAGVTWQGVWQRSASYTRGMMATDSGSLWYCTSDDPTHDRPGTSSAWQLMSKSK